MFQGDFGNMNTKVLNKLIEKSLGDEPIEGVDDIEVYDIVIRSPFKINLIIIDTEPILKGIQYRDVYKKVYRRIMNILEVMGENTREWDIRFNERLLENEEDFPFEQVEDGDKKVRVFSEDVDTEELVWHRDREDRIIEVVESKNWMLQIDNKLPIKMRGGDTFVIPEGVYHRVLKGDGNLKISITFT